MKKIITISLSFMLVLISCNKKDTVDHSSHNDNQYNSHDEHVSTGLEIIDLMHAPMVNQPFQRSTNPDVDYIYNMIPHHQGAIDASKRLLETTTNKEIIALAKAIITAQEKEISEFNALIPELQAKNTDYSDIDVSSIGNKAEMVNDKMISDMSSIITTGDNDICFLSGMIPHHQGAIDASKQILEVTRDDKIKEIAKKIITDQEREIVTMNNLLATLQSSASKTTQIN